MFPTVKTRRVLVPLKKCNCRHRFATPSVSNNSRVIGSPKGRMPTAAPGFEVSLFAENFDNPRLAYILPNEDILVVEVGSEFPDRPQKSVNRITLFRDTNKDGKPDVREIFLTRLNMSYACCYWAIGSMWETPME
jgi:glucose/arabinose dehydrogenase